MAPENTVGTPLAGAALLVLPGDADIVAAAAAMADLVVLVSSRTSVLPLKNRFYCSGLP